MKKMNERIINTITTRLATFFLFLFLEGSFFFFILSSFIFPLTVISFFSFFSDILFLPFLNFFFSFLIIPYLSAVYPNATKIRRSIPTITLNTIKPNKNKIRPIKMVISKSLFFFTHFFININLHAFQIINSRIIVFFN